MNTEKNITCPKCNTVFRVDSGNEKIVCPFCDYRIINSNLDSSVKNEIIEKHNADYSTLICPEDRLTVEFTSRKPKDKLKISFENSKNADVLTPGQEKTYHLNYGEYVITLKRKRKKYTRGVIIAPGDEPIHIHYIRDKKDIIKIDQSEYANKISQKRVRPRLYTKLLTITERWNNASIFFIIALFFTPTILFLITIAYAWISWKIHLLLLLFK